MVLVDQVQKPLEEFCALLLGQTVNVPDMAAHGEDALPPCNRVGTHNGMDRFELAADVLRSAAGLIVELEASRFSHLLKTGLLKGGRKTLEELLVRLADAVVNLVSRSPKRVWSYSSVSEYCRGSTSVIIYLHRWWATRPSAETCSQQAQARMQCRYATGHCAASWC